MQPEALRGTPPPLTGNQLEFRLFSVNGRTSNGWRMPFSRID